MVKRKWTFGLVMVLLLCAILTAVACSEKVKQLVITGIPENGTIEMTVNDMTFSVDCNADGAEWNSSDAAVAVIDSEGTITLKGAGATVISARKGDLSAEFILTVVDKRIPSATCEIGGVPENNTVSVEDGEIRLTASCSDNSPVVWYSRNKAIATVDSSGKVTLLARGTVEIVAQSANDSSVFAVCTLRVLGVASQGIASIGGLPQSGKIGVGNEYSLSAVETPQDCEPSEIVWSIRDTSIAKVTAEGVLTGVSAGTTELTASAQDGKLTKTVSIEVVNVVQNYEDFTTAKQIGNYIAGVIEIRDSENILSPELVADGDNYYLKYSHRMADGDGKYMVYSFSDLKPGVRYVLEYNMKLLSVSDGTYDHQINVYGGQTEPIAMGDPLTGTLYAWSASNLDTSDKKVYQTGGTALYCDGQAYEYGSTSTGEFRTYTLAFIAGESTVGFGFVNACTYEVLFDYICVREAPSVDDFSIDCPAESLPLNETMTLSAVATEDLLYYQPFAITYTSSDENIAKIDGKGVLTPVSEGEVTITAEDANLGKEHSVTITITSSIDRESYDLFFDDTDSRIDNSYLCLLYELEQPVAGTLHQGYWIEIEIDTVYYRGPIEFYLAVLNTDADVYGNVADTDLMAFKDWGQIRVPDSGESSTQKYLIYLEWERSDYTIDHLGVYVRNATEFKIGVNVDVQTYDESSDPDAANYDAFISGSGWNDNAVMYTLAETPFAAQNYTVTISLDLTILTGNITQIYIALYSGDVLFLNSDGLEQGREDGWITASGSGHYEFTGEFLWAQAGNLDKADIRVYGEGGYRVGIDNISVDIEKPDTSGHDKVIEAQGDGSAAFTFEQAQFAAQNYTVTISMDMAAVSGSVARIRILLYSGEVLFLNQDLLDGVTKEGEWIVVDALGKLTFTGTFDWNLYGNIDKAVVMVTDPNAYIVGINDFSIKIEKPDTSGYDKVIEGNGWENNSVTIELAEPPYAAQNYTVTITMDLTVVSGSISTMYIGLYNNGSDSPYLNPGLLDGVELTNDGWIVVSKTGTLTFTGTFDWPLQGNIDYADIRVYGEGTYIVGINDFAIAINAPAEPEPSEEFDIQISAEEWSSDTAMYAIAQPPYAAQNYTVTISMDLTVVSGSIDKIYIALYSGEAQFLNPNDLDNVTLTEGWISLSELKGYTFTGKFQWAQEGTIDKINIIVHGANFVVGINNLTITTQAPQIPEPEEPVEEGYLISGSGWEGKADIAIDPAVSAGAGATLSIILKLEMVSGSLDELYIQIYNAANEMVATCGWDQSVAAGSGEYTFTSTGIAEAASNFDISKITVMLHKEGGAYEVRINPVSIEVQNG